MVTQKSGVMHRHRFDRVECYKEYIDESIGTFGEGLKEHHKAPSPTYEHFSITGHHTSLDNFSIVRRESQTLSKTHKSSYIQKGE